MIITLDTNVLLDILIPNSTHVQASLKCLTSFDHTAKLTICEVVCAELGSQFKVLPELTNFLKDTGIQVVSSNAHSLFEASCSWKKYAARKKAPRICPFCGKHQQSVCTSCKNPLSYRQHIISDFLIGAHAKMQAEKLVTRDRGFYRHYFKDLEIISPV
jgi:predicted nucleic acid-binding protein